MNVASLMNAAPLMNAASQIKRQLLPTPSFAAWKPDAYASAPARVEDMVLQHAQRLALKDPSQSLTYAEMNAAANRLAHAILGCCGPGEENVGLLLGHDIWIIVSILAALKAGKAYVPLDPGYPPPRLAAMMAGAQLRLVVTDASRKTLAETLAPAGTQLLVLEELPGNLSESSPQVEIKPGRRFNLIYTSGSSGEPKGVPQIHRNVLFDVCQSAHQLSLCPDDRVALIIPCAFGASVSDIFGALFNGGSVILLDLKSAGLDRLAGWLDAEAITVYHSVPTVFRQLMNMVDPGRIFSQIRILKLGGETLLRNDFELFQRHFSDGCVLRNGLGTTETYAATSYLLERSDEVDRTVVPLGYPTSGREILILDEDRNPVAPGETGQIAVRSACLTPGYWRRPDLTEAAFLPDPEGGDRHIYLTGDLGRLLPDGCLEYYGRKDSMVKVHGYRVELAEVEAALLNIEFVKDAVVTVQKRPGGEDALVAYVILAEGEGNLLPPYVTSLREQIRARLPDYMIPAAFVQMEAFPLLPFGKVNRRALPVPDWTRPELDRDYVAPRSPAESLLAEALGAVLKLPPREGRASAGIDDNFFDLGLDSILAVQLIVQLRAACGVEVSLQQVYENPTVAQLALLLEGAQGGGEKRAEQDTTTGLDRALRLLGEV